jgi:hypothetical protein
MWSPPKKRAKDITNIYEFQRKTPGYLQLRLSQWEQPDHGHFEPITWESQRYSILKRCYVAPYACSIFRDHAALVAGLRMDMTWRIIHLSVASILTVVIGNVGILIALSFSPVEDTGLKETVDTTRRELFDFDLSAEIIESDQASALRAICTKYRNAHLICWRHVLVALGRGPFPYEIGHLVRCRCDTDFERVKS